MNGRRRVTGLSTSTGHRAELALRCLDDVDAIDIVSDRVFPRHSHDQFGVGVMRSGGHASWSGSGGVEAGPGDVIAVSPDEMNDGAPIGGPRAWEMVFVDPAAVARLVGPKAARREIGFAATTSRHFASSVRAATSALFAREVSSAEQTLTRLFADLLTSSAPVGDRAPSAATLRVLERIRDRPDAPPPLDKVAALMEMGRTGALRRFHREVGATPHDYAMQVRLRLARRALADGESPAAVAVDLGFADQSHLTRAFRRQFGLTPGRYRSAKAKIVQDREGPEGL